MTMQPSREDSETTSSSDASAPPLRVLFLCADNAARSPMAEAILRSLGRLHFAAFSAGVEPADAVDPHVLTTLKERDISSDGLVPKGLQAFEGQSFDYVITLADP